MKGNPYCVCCRDYSARIFELENELKLLREDNERMTSLISAGPRTPNTDMIMDAILSGGDPIATAKILAGKNKRT